MRTHMRCIVPAISSTHLGLYQAQKWGRAVTIEFQHFESNPKILKIYYFCCIINNKASCALSQHKRICCLRSIAQIALMRQDMPDVGGRASCRDGWFLPTQRLIKCLRYGVLQRHATSRFFVSIIISPVIASIVYRFPWIFILIIRLCGNIDGLDCGTHKVCQHPLGRNQFYLCERMARWHTGILDPIGIRKYNIVLMIMPLPFFNLLGLLQRFFTRPNFRYLRFWAEWGAAQNRFSFLVMNFSE